MSMTDVTDQTDKVQDYSKRIFIALVMATVDPKKCHRIKIMIPDLLEGDVAELPWAIPAAIGGGHGPNEGKQWIPEVGSKVYVTLQDGDTHYPVYHGGVPSFDSVRSVLAVNYPHRVGFVVNSYTEKNSGEDRRVTFESKTDPTPYPEKGHHFFLDRSTNEVEYQHPQGTKINIASNGKVSLIVDNKSGPAADLVIDVVKGNANIHVKGNVTEHVEGNVTQRVDGNVSTTVKGNATANIGGTTDVTSGGALSITAPTNTINGPTKINGALTVAGASSLGGNVSVGGNLNASGSISDADGDGGA